MVKTVTLTAGTPQAVTFSEAYPFYWIDNKTSGEVYASVGGTPEPGKDGTYTIAAGSQMRISGGDFNGGIVLLGEGKVQVVASGIAACPFKSAPVSGGGEGGDADTVNGHTVEADVPADAVFTDTTYDAATLTEDGLMSAADKTKLDGIEEGANKTVVDTALSSTSTNPVQNKVINAALSGKADSSHSHSNATTSSSGFMSSSDKTKLNGIETGANKTVVDTALSSTSTNPLQNKAIYQLLQSLGLGSGDVTIMINGQELIDGKLELTQGLVPSDGTAYQMPYYIQSGTVTVTADIRAGASITFPKAFKSTPLLALAGPSSLISGSSNPAPVIVTYGNLSSKGFTLYPYGTSSGSYNSNAMQGVARWIAFGKI